MRSGADLNGDNLRFSTAYLRISDHCRVRVRVRIRVWVRVRVRVRSGSGSVVKVRGLGGLSPLLPFEPPCNSMSPPLIESIKYYFTPK